MSDKIQDLMDEAGDELLQKIIHRQEGAQGVAESDLSGPSPTEAELTKWTQALDQLERQAPPRPPRSRLRRAVVLTVLLGAALLATAGAFHTQILNWIETVHEEYTQLQAGNTAQETVDSWTGVYLPTDLPPRFSISAADKYIDFSVIEYNNSEGSRLTFYQYASNSSVNIDTEKADKTITTVETGQTAYLYEKGDLSTLYWQEGDLILSVEFNPDVVQMSDIQTFVGSIQWKQSQK